MKLIIKNCLAFVIFSFIYLLIIAFSRNSLLYFYYTHYNFFFIFAYYLYLINHYLPSVLAFPRYSTLFHCYLSYFLKFSCCNLCLNIYLFLLVTAFNLLFNLHIFFTNCLLASISLFILGEIFYLLFSLLIWRKSWLQYIVLILFILFFSVSRVSDFSLGIYNIFSYYNISSTFSFNYIIHYLFWLALSLIFFSINMAGIKK